MALRPGTQDFDWYEPVTARWVVLAVLLAPLFALVWLAMPLLQLLAWLVKRRGLR